VLTTITSAIYFTTTALCGQVLYCTLLRLRLCMSTNPVGLGTMELWLPKCSGGKETTLVAENSERLKELC
jgi:hypothetical protein